MMNVASTGECQAIPPFIREIQEVKDKVAEIREGMDLFGEQPALPEPEEWLLAQVRGIVHES